MDKNLYEHIENNLKTQTIEVDGRQFVTRNVYEVPAKRTMPSEMQFHNLSAFIEFLHKDIEGQNEKLFINVLQHDQIMVCKAWDGIDPYRHTYLKAHYDFTPNFKTGTFYEQQEFRIRVSSCFVMPDENYNEKSSNEYPIYQVLHHSGEIKTVVSETSRDSPYSQRVTVESKTTAGDVSEDSIGIFKGLQMWRTWPEIEQPKSDYIFRIKNVGKDVHMALFDYGNDKWKYEARNAVVEHIEKISKEKNFEVPIF